MSPTRLSLSAFLCSLCSLCVPSFASPDDRKAAPAPPAPEAVERAVAAPYLTPDEARDKRIFFGRWERDDLNTPARAARAALVRGVYDDPSLAAPDADPIDRADAALARGEPAGAIELVKDRTELRAARIRAAALETLGRFDDAVAAAQPALDRIIGKVLSDPADAVEGVRMVAQRIRLRGPTAGGAADYQALMHILAEVRTVADRLYWPAYLAEAELLFEKDNSAQAKPALITVLALNPSCAKAWALMGRLVVDSFAMDAAEACARRLDLIAADDYDPLDPDKEPAVDAPATPTRVSALSPYGGLIIARAMLRQVDGAQAASALEPVLARYPHHAMALALHAASDAARFDFDAVNASLGAFDTLFPGNPLAYFEVGRALSEARQYAQAAAFLDEAHTRQPFAPEPLIERGLLEVQAGRDRQALDALEKAFELDPFNARADNSLRLVRELATYATIETPHYLIRYRPPTPEDAAAGGPDEILAREMPDILEENYRLVTAAPTADKPGGIDFTLPEGSRTTIDLMPDHKWFGVRIAGMPRIHTVAASTGPVVAMESPRDGPGHMGTYDWARVLRHEYSHTISLARTDYRVPHWFTEACAVYLEYSPRDYQACLLLAGALDSGSLFDFREINLAFVRPKRPSDRSQAYAQGHWMYTFLIERFGPRAPLDLMDQYAKGVREEQAFQSVLQVSREEFMTRFLPWARDQVIAWGLAVPPGTPTIKDLITRDAESDAKPAEGNAGDEPPGEDAPTVPPTPEAIARWLAQHPAHPDVLELAMDEAVRASARLATPESAPMIERYAAARPVDPRPHRLLAKMYLDRAAANPGTLADEAARAIPHLEFLDRREQNSPLFAMELAKRYAALGDLASATARAERATRVAPFNAPARELAATTALRAKDYATGERHITALTLIEPDREIHKKRLEAVRRMRAEENK